MKIFISWSGETSKATASILRKYFPYVINDLDIFMSKNDLESGVRWSIQLAKELEETDFGIICLTPENLESSWILFEAGALTKHTESRACGLLIAGLSPVDVSGPLSQFQNRVFEESEVYALLVDINKKLEKPIESHQLESVFKKWWPDIFSEYEQLLDNSRTTNSQPIKREQQDMLEEILLRVRGLERSLLPQKATEPKLLLSEVFSEAERRLTPNQRELMYEIANASNATDIKQLLDKYSESDFQSLEKFSLINRKNDSVSFPHILIKEFFSNRKY